MTSIDYMAGFFDGEGSVSALVRFRKNRPNPYFAFRVNVTNAVKEPCLAFQKAFGGYITHRPGSKKKKESWRWNLNMGRESLEKFARAMQGRLIIKAPHIEVILEYLANCQFELRGQSLVREEIAKRKTYFERVRLLNARHTVRSKPLRKTWFTNTPVAPAGVNHAPQEEAS